MFNIINKELNYSLLSSIVYIILGIIIVINPRASLETVSIVVGILAIVYGCIITIINITKLRGIGNPLFGILLVISGIFLLIYPDSLSILLALVVGIWFIANSINRIKLAVMLQNSKDFNWLLLLIISVITLLAGLVFIFAPLASAITLALTIGILMIVYSVCDFIEVLMIKKNAKSIEKALKEFAS